MKQKLMMLLAVLLTGGMLVACGPGDEGATDTTGEGGTVTDPLADDAAGDGAIAEPDTDLADDPAAADAGTEEQADTTVELTPEEDAPASEDAAADQTGGDADVAQEETQQEDTQADAQASEEQSEGDVAGGGAAAPAEGEAITVTLTQAAEGVSVVQR